MINKKKISELLAQRTLLGNSEAKQVTNEVFNIIKSCLLDEKEVYIIGFGKFFLERQKERPVRNPKTMEEMTLKPFNKIKFRPSVAISKELKKRG